MRKWKSGLIEWQEDNIIYISVVFSWLINKATKLARQRKEQGFEVVSGGPAIGGNLSDVVRRHNPNATFTSRGCPRKCPFCIVPKIEGNLRELEEWPVRSTICDNNLLACSIKHFDSVIDKLKSLEKVDFNQGLDARFLTKYHANRLRELDTSVIRLAWDHTKLETQFMKAFQILRLVGFPASHIRVYVLIGFNDTPEDALYRLQKVRDLKALPNPMRYQPINIEKKNSYIGEHWNNQLLQHYMRYWSRLRYTSPIPFNEFKNHRGLVVNDMIGHDN